MHMGHQGRRPSRQTRAQASARHLSEVTLPDPLTWVLSCSDLDPVLPKAEQTRAHGPPACDVWGFRTRRCILHNLWTRVEVSAFQGETASGSVSVASSQILQ